ncbi:MAG: hypothetical protein ACXVNN_04215 [Bacteroidia bacterium]
MILPIIYTILFILLIRKMAFFSIPELSYKAIISVFLLKIIAGIALLLIFTSYYKNSDSIAFFNDSKVMYDVLWQNPAHFFKMFTGIGSADPVLDVYYSKMSTWNASFENVLFNDSRSIIRLNVLFRFFSFGNFYAHTVFMCFLSLIGLTALYKTFDKYFAGRKKILFVIIFLLPGVLFWSSGVLKEGLLFFGMGLLLYATECGFSHTYSLKKIIIVLFSISILLFVKVYILIALAPGLISNYWIGKSPGKFIFLKYCTVYFCCFLLLIIISVLKPQYDPLKIIANKQEKSAAFAKGGVFLLSTDYFVRVDYDQKNIALLPVKENYFKIKLNSSYDAWKINNLKDTLRIKNSTDTSTYKLMYSIPSSKSVIAPLQLKPSFVSIIKNVPIAFYNTLAQPFDFCTRDWLRMSSSLENLFYILIILSGFICFKFPKENTAVILFCFSIFAFVFILAGLTTPVVGALVRYKVPALPFMMIFIFMMTDDKKWKKIPLIGKYFIN